MKELFCYCVCELYDDWPVVCKALECAVAEVAVCRDLDLRCRVVDVDDLVYDLTLLAVADDV